MSAYYSFNPIASSCDFGGNATLAASSKSCFQILLHMRDLPSVVAGGQGTELSPTTGVPCLALSRVLIFKLWTWSLSGFASMAACVRRVADGTI